MPSFHEFYDINLLSKFFYASLFSSFKRLWIVNFLNNIKFPIFHDKHESAHFFCYLLALVDNDLVFFEKPGLETFNKIEQIRLGPILKVRKIAVEFQR
jgi:hypothetical protein